MIKYPRCNISLHYSQDYRENNSLENSSQKYFVKKRLIPTLFIFGFIELNFIFFYLFFNGERMWGKNKKCVFLILDAVEKSRRASQETEHWRTYSNSRF